MLKESTLAVNHAVCHGYYLFYSAILCGDYIREGRLYESDDYVLLDTAEVEKSDPFADVEEDENELEENEVVLVLLLTVSCFHQVMHARGLFT